MLVPLEVIFHAEMFPVKVEAQLTFNVVVFVTSEVNQLVIVAQLFTVKVQAVKFVIFQLAADNSQPTDKSDSAVTFQLNVEVQLTVNVSVPNEVAVAVHRLDVVAFRLVIVASVEVNVSIVPFSAVMSHSNHPSAVTLPVKVTSPSTVWSVT
ncbi:MAG: hypothetical protein J6S85_23495 [Methanobrevibacter sp.]|nr:hypothetical protein [Methanobrevibacter sp.]